MRRLKRTCRQIFYNIRALRKHVRRELFSRLYAWIRQRVRFFFPDRDAQFMLRLNALRGRWRRLWRECLNLSSVWMMRTRARLLFLYRRAALLCKAQRVRGSAPGPTFQLTHPGGRLIARGTFWWGGRRGKGNLFAQSGMRTVSWRRAASLASSSTWGGSSVRISYDGLATMITEPGIFSW